MTWFAGFSWLSTILTSVMLLKWLRNSPSVWVRPSFIFIASLHLTTQWASAANAVWIDTYLLDPWGYFWVIQGFPPMAILVARQFHLKAMEGVLKPIRELSGEGSRTFYLIICLLSFVSLMVMTWYLSVVPYYKTGLYGAFFNSSESALLRENSLKLLNNQWLKYAYAIFSRTIAPLLVVLLLMTFGFKSQLRRIVRWPILLVGVSSILVSVSIYGARAPALMILAVMGYATTLMYGQKIKSGWILFAGIPALLAPITISFFRVNKERTLEQFFLACVDLIDRIVSASTVDAVWHAAFYESFGGVGIRGIGNIVRIVGLEPIDVFNQVGRLFSLSGIDSVTANTTFVMAYYACFGLLGVVISLALLPLMDSVVYFYRLLSPTLLVPCVASVQIAAIYFSATHFTAALLTFGFLLIPIFCYLLTITLRLFNFCWLKEQE